MHAGSSKRARGPLEARARRLGRVAAVLAAAIAAFVAPAGCGGSGAEGTESAGGKDAAAEVRVAYVADSAGLEDGGFNELAAEGLERAGEELGVETMAVALPEGRDYAAEVRELAEDGYDLVIVGGFNLIEAVAEASRDFPETSFAITDIPVAEVPGAGDNLRGLPFDQEPAGVLAGYLAGLSAAEEDEGATVGVIGGQRIPPVESWIRGFRVGLAEAAPSVEAVVDYSGTFEKPRRCERIADEQIAAGAVLIFEAAARCGIAAIERAGESGVFAIGTDGDYLDLGDHVLASALKRTDIAVFETVRDLLDDNFRGGEDRLFTIADGGVGLSEFGPAVPPRIREAVEQRAAALAAEDLG